MTRLVGVHAVCDGCSAAAATVFCVSHRNVLCPSCNIAQHSNPSTASHQRVDLSSAVTALPFCEHCDDAPATTYCESESSTFCDKCDTIVHESVEAPHWRTPIERTLRSRAVEFRVSSRPRQTGRPRPSMPGEAIPSDQQPQSPEKRQNGKEAPKAKAKPPDPKPPTSGPSAAQQASKSTPMDTTRPSAPLPSFSMGKQPRSKQPETKSSPRRKAANPSSSSTLPGALPPRHSTTQKRRPRPLAKRKRDLQRLSQQQQQSVRPLDVLFSRADVIPTPTDDFFAYQHGTRTSQPLTYGLPSTLPMSHTQAHHLQEPLMNDAASPYLDIDMLSYEGLDLSGEATAVEGINGSGRSASASAADSGDSSRHKTPDMDMLPDDPAMTHGTPTPAEVVASAVVAGGEQYLLNSVSTGSGSSRERESPSGDMPGDIDPASELVAVANAAAASAVAQAAAGGGLSNQTLKTMPFPIAMDGMSNAMSARTRQPRITRRMSESGIPTARDMAKVEAARDAISDEAMRRLEIETRRAKQEEFIHAETMGCERTEGNSDQLVAQMSDGDDVLRRGEDMGYLEISRDDFGGVFDSIDLSQFDQSSSVGLGFGPGDFRATLDSDEG